MCVIQCKANPDATSAVEYRRTVQLLEEFPAKLVKYASLDTIKYVYCSNHGLLYGHEISTNKSSSEMCNCCGTCSKERREPIYDNFDYIPLLPRIRACASHSKSINVLFGDGSDSRETERTNGGFNDFTDGSLYKEIVTTSGGKEYCKYDLFMGASFDGFQLFFNHSYDFWPIAAINLNLAHKYRFLMHNVIPFGFIRGSRQPANLESYLAPLVYEIDNINRSGGVEWKFLHNGNEEDSSTHAVVHY